MYVLVTGSPFDSSRCFNKRLSGHYSKTFESPNPAIFMVSHDATHFLFPTNGVDGIFAMLPSGFRGWGPRTILEVL